MNEPQLHDTVIDGDHWYRIVAFSEDRGTKLSDGRWVCASKFVPVTRACWRYEPIGVREQVDTPALAPSLVDASDVMDRGDIFRAAHALVQDLEWDEKASVYDVLQVAKWLEGEG